MKKESRHFRKFYLRNGFGWGETFYYLKNEKRIKRRRVTWSYPLNIGKMYTYYYGKKLEEVLS